MQLTHRPVQEKDIPLICRFPKNADELFFLFPKALYPLATEQLQDAISNRSDSTVVELNGEMVGFANFYRYENGGICSIGNVIIKPSARGCGVGSYLIKQMIEIARWRHSATQITVSCFNHNTSGLLFYPTLGFQPYAIEERSDNRDTRVALIHMRLLLQVI